MITIEHDDNILDVLNAINAELQFKGVDYQLQYDEAAMEESDTQILLNLLPNNERVLF